MIAANEPRRVPKWIELTFNNSMCGMTAPVRSSMPIAVLDECPLPDLGVEEFDDSYGLHRDRRDGARSSRPLASASTHHKLPRSRASKH